MNRFLITTALEETWRNDAPVLFLGEWCRRYDRKEKWRVMDGVVARYHWDDRQKLHSDYLYLRGLHEALLAELAVRLNVVHGTNHPLRYWRILLGLWVGYFIQALFDRWESLRLATEEFDIIGANVIADGEAGLIANDMDEFQDAFVSDAWNEAICGRLLACLGVPTSPVLRADELLSHSGQAGRLGLLRRLKRVAARVLSVLSGLTRRESEYFFISTYLPLLQDLLLQWRLGQLPKLWRPVRCPVTAADADLRRQLAAPAAAGHDFASVARSMLFETIPTVYLEGYRALIAEARQLPWPRKPKAIFTSNSWAGDDVFKAWAADKAVAGVPLLLGQHGGNYGMALWNFSEEHQIAIADRFLTWGWQQSDVQNLLALGNLKGFSRKHRYNRQGKALLVEMAIPRFSYHMYSAPVARQWLDYFEDQCRFVGVLPASLRNELVVRLSLCDFGWRQEQRWRDRYPEIRLDDGRHPMASLLGASRLCISTYNATSYLESMSANIPTIVYWNPDQWELRPTAEEDLQMLAQAGIFHRRPEDAAHHMARIWDDVDGWWQSGPVQRARETFCRRYAFLPQQPLAALEAACRQAAAAGRAGAQELQRIDIPS